MWTPKRVLLLSAGLVVFFAAYAVYAFFLGRIDGMPPLPAEFDPGGIIIDDPPPETSDIQKKLIQAFGPGCPQYKQDLQIEVRKKDMVIAADKAFCDEPDGRVKLTKFSVAIFKRALPGHWPEISTISSDTAFLRFDKPIQNITECTNSKILGAELVGDITIINNQKTQKTSDDLEVIIGDEFGRKQGKLFYDEPTGRIWTEQWVQLLDKKTQPHPTKITGLGMDMLLAKEQPEDKKKSHNPNASSDFNGVEQIVLKQRVEMDLYPDGNSGFMTDGSKPPQQTANQPAADKSHVKIKTEGPFVYEVPKDIARFSSPPDEKSTHRVTVERRLLSEESKQSLDIRVDQLVCNILTLKFKKSEPAAKAADKKPAPKAPAGKADADADAPAENGREIESALATARPGETVTVAMDSQKMHCECQILDYQCPTKDRGARTVLRGTPTIPLDGCKDGNRILTLEMVLVGADSNGANQHMFAQGPGKIDLYDKKTDSYHSHAIFKGQLTQTKLAKTKYKDGERDLDLLILTEDAAFIEDDTRDKDGQIKTGQKLYGQILKLWLAPTDAPPKAVDAKPGAAAAADDSPRQKPIKLEAFDRVRLDGSQFRIQDKPDCLHLIVRFTDVAPVPLAALQPGQGASKSISPSQQPPTGRPGPLPPGGSASAQQPLTAGVAGPQPPAPPLPSGPPAKDGPKEQPKPPIDVWAKDVSADVVRGGIIQPDGTITETNDLDKFVAVGNAHVHQNGAKPGDKGVDIIGETIMVKHFKEGDTLTVFADQKKEQVAYAEVQLDKMYLVGKHEVIISQPDNTVDIAGIGAMSMPSNAALGGGQEAKPGSVLTIHWNRGMLFDGVYAHFDGNVVAYQNGSTMQCQSLQVELDRPVSLKEGQKEDQPAKVKTLIANGVVGPVVARDDPKDSTEEVTFKKQLVAQQIVVNTHTDEPNSPSDINARGPGTMTIVRKALLTGLLRRASSTPANAPKQAKEPAKQQEWMRTNIDFADRLYSTQLDEKTRKSKFLGNILVVYAPGDKLDVGVDTTKPLPKGGMVLQCEVLTVLTHDHNEIDPVTHKPKIDPATGKTKTVQTQSMQAEQRVQCWTPELFIQADTAVFDDVQDIITFRGNPGNLARVARRVGAQGSEPQWTTGTTIRYNRKTATVEVENSRGMGG